MDERVKRVNESNKYAGREKLNGGGGGDDEYIIVEIREFDESVTSS